MMRRACAAFFLVAAAWSCDTPDASFETTGREARTEEPPAPSAESPELKLPEATDLPADPTPPAAPGVEGSESEPLVVGGEVAPPIRISGERMVLPPADCRWAGVAIVQTTIDTEGRVGEMRFLAREPPECLQVAIRANLSTWRFEPARLHGEPVAVLYNLTVRFHPR